MKATLIIIATIFSFLLGLHFYPNIAQTRQVHYRLNYSISTPYGVKTGSGVWGYYYSPTFYVLSFKWRYFRRIEGDAIAINIGHKQTIYAVLGGRTNPRDLGAGLESAKFNHGFMNIMPLEQFRHWGIESPLFSTIDSTGANQELDWVTAQKGHEISVNCASKPKDEEGDCPAMVLVNDKDGDRKLTILNPENLESELGRGFKLNRVTLTVVDDIISRGLQKQSPWAHLATENDLISGYRSSEEEIRAVGFIRNDTP